LADEVSCNFGSSGSRVDPPLCAGQSEGGFMDEEDAQSEKIQVAVAVGAAIP
jgi:hypothetical protein